MQVKPWENKEITIYKGWRVYAFRHHDQTLFGAYRFGVTMNTNNLDDLRNMIDLKEIERQCPLIKNS